MVLSSAIFVMWCAVAACTFETCSLLAVVVSTLVYSIFPQQ